MFIKLFILIQHKGTDDVISIIKKERKKRHEFHEFHEFQRYSLSLYIGTNWEDFIFWSVEFCKLSSLSLLKKKSQVTFADKLQSELINFRKKNESIFIIFSETNG